MLKKTSIILTTLSASTEALKLNDVQSKSLVEMKNGLEVGVQEHLGVEARYYKNGEDSLVLLETEANVEATVGQSFTPTTCSSGI